MHRFITVFLFGLAGCIGVTEPSVSTFLKDYNAKHTEALNFCKKHNFSEEYYFLIDMSVHSGRDRFFIYDFRQQKIIDSNPVTHGSCDIFEINDRKYEKAKFSNRDGSHCSSLGKYKIGKRDYSSWGINIKYWLHGVEDTNSNAEARVVVLHSWPAVPDEEVYPDYAPLSWGCPAVSDNFMKVLDQQLQIAKKPVLLWIVN